MKNDKLSLQISEGKGSPRARSIPIAYCVCDFFFHEYPNKPTENTMLQCLKHGFQPTGMWQFYLNITQL